MVFCKSLFDEAFDLIDKAAFEHLITPFFDAVVEDFIGEVEKPTTEVTGDEVFVVKGGKKVRDALISHRDDL